jgi:hypothetical protein
MTLSYSQLNHKNRSYYQQSSCKDAVQVGGVECKKGKTIESLFGFKNNNNNNNSHILWRWNSFPGTEPKSEL